MNHFCFYETIWTFPKIVIALCLVHLHYLMNKLDVWPPLVQFDYFFICSLRNWLIDFCTSCDKNIYFVGHTEVRFYFRFVPITRRFVPLTLSKINALLYYIIRAVQLTKVSHSAVQWPILLLIIIISAIWLKSVMTRFD